MTKNGHFSTLFDSVKNCPYDSNGIFYSHSTPDYGQLCAISLNLYGWDWSESEAKRPKSTPLPHISGLFRFSQNLSTRFERIFYCRSMSYLCPMCAMTSKSDYWNLGNSQNYSKNDKVDNLFFNI